MNKKKLLVTFLVFCVLSINSCSNNKAKEYKIECTNNKWKLWKKQCDGND
jgi:hypothetical protein